MLIVKSLHIVFDESN